MATTEINGIENNVLRGFTIRNAIVMVVCTASMVGTVLTTHFTDKQDKALMDLRIKVLEAQVQALAQKVDAVYQARH